MSIIMDMNTHLIMGIDINNVFNMHMTMDTSMHRLRSMHLDMSMQLVMNMIMNMNMYMHIHNYMKWTWA